jgi:hypothetical protein
LIPQNWLPDVREVDIQKDGDVIVVKPNPVFPPEQEIRSCYTLRTLVRFVGFLGLATVEPVATDKPCLSKYRVKKLPLLDKAVRFLSKG